MHSRIKNITFRFAGFLLLISIPGWTSEAVKPVGTPLPFKSPKKITLKMTIGEYLEFKRKHGDNPNFTELAAADSLIKSTAVKDTAKAVIPTSPVSKNISKDTSKVQLKKLSDSSLKKIKAPEIKNLSEDIIKSGFSDSSLSTDSLTKIQDTAKRVTSTSTENTNKTAKIDSSDITTIDSTVDTLQFIGAPKKQIQTKKRQPAPPTEIEVIETHEGSSDIVQGVVEVSGDVLDGADGGDEFAILIFIVIGFVVVAVLLVTGLKIFYDVVFNHKKFPRWTEVSGMYTYSYNDINENLPNKYSQYTNMASLKVTTGLVRRRIGVGVVGEVGNIDITLHENFGVRSVLNVNSIYVIMGPVIRFGSNPRTHFDLEFLNGFSPSSEIGWVGMARGLFKIPLKDKYFLGIHFGSFFADLKEIQGILVRDYELNLEMSLLFGGSIGFQF